MRVLVANRGEIAIRIIRACRQMGLQSILAVSDVDLQSAARAEADDIVCIGPAPAAQSYASKERIVAAALGRGCAVVHPGYGFLSEDPALAEMCCDAGLIFVGPDADQLRRLGAKDSALQLAKKLEIPTIRGSSSSSDVEQVMKAIVRLRFPVMVKAVSGGGGRGMRLAEEADALPHLLRTASREAEAAFGDARVYLEEVVENAAHVEVQVIGDGTDVVHLGDRDCSVQRRKQKVIEEAPSRLEPELQEEIANAAVRLASAVDYKGAGTAEFLVTPEGSFYFIEFNPRLQVEHGVTEAVTDIDIVKMQFRVALEGKLPISQDDIRIEGAAIEARVLAEDPARDFLPQPGELESWSLPSDTDLRVDTHCYAGYIVPPHYDSLLAKVIAKGRDREGAINRLRSALLEADIRGIDTNITFLIRVLSNEKYRKGWVSTSWVEDRLLELVGSPALEGPQ